MTDADFHSREWQDSEFPEGSNYPYTDDELSGWNPARAEALGIDPDDLDPGIDDNLGADCEGGSIVA